MTDETTNLMEKPEESGREASDSDALARDELRKLYEESCAGIKEGAIVKGKIIKITNDGVYVDVGYKSEGIVPLSEFSNPALVKAGEDVDVYLETMEDAEGMIVLSRIKAEKQKRWDETILRSKEGDVVKGKITRKVRGGVIVDIGMEAFLPASQIDIRHVSNVDEYMGKVLEYKIIKINTERKNIVLSRRELLEEERSRNREKLLSEIEIGEIREGVVKNITDFGAFIDLYGMDGLLHITDMTWGRVNHPSEMVSVGQKVRVMVLDFDRERQRIALGLKQTTPNPWQDIASKYPVGSIVKGKIVNIVPYGAFFEIEKGVEGLIHISEMSWTKRINHPSEILSVGDEVEAMVLNIKKDEAKISLGIKQTEFNPWSVVEEKYPPGSRIRGRVRNITSYGAFVELEEGIDGLIHISDMSWTRKINHPTEVVKKGEITEALVLAVDQEAKKITLGLKQLQSNPWETIDQFIQVGLVVEAEVTKIADFGVFATIENGIECLIHISQLSDKPFEKIEDTVKRGDKVRAKVDRIDKQRRKIALSIKDYQRDLRLSEEKVAMEAVKAMSLGDESIGGMKEHIEQAVEQLSSPAEVEAAHDTAEAAEAGKEAEAPPAAEEQPPESQLTIGEPEQEPTLEVPTAEQEVELEKPGPEEPPAEETTPEFPVEKTYVTPEEPPSQQPPPEEIPPEPSSVEEGFGEEEPAFEEPPAEESTPEAFSAETAVPTDAAEPFAETEMPPVAEEQPPESQLTIAEPEQEPTLEVPAAEQEVEVEKPGPEEPPAEETTPEFPVEKTYVTPEEPPSQQPPPEEIPPEPSSVKEGRGEEEPPAEESTPEAFSAETAVPTDAAEPSAETEMPPEPSSVKEGSGEEEPAFEEPPAEESTPEAFSAETAVPTETGEPPAETEMPPVAEEQPPESQLTIGEPELVPMPEVPAAEEDVEMEKAAPEEPAAEILAPEPSGTEEGLADKALPLEEPSTEESTQEPSSAEPSSETAPPAEAAEPPVGAEEPAPESPAEPELEEKPSVEGEEKPEAAADSEDEPEEKGEVFP